MLVMMMTHWLLLLLLTPSSAGGLALPPPARPRLSVSVRGPTKVETGGSVLLTCSASGSPLPRVAWYRDSLFLAHLEDQEDLLEGDPTSLGETVARLRLSCLREEEGGELECRAVSGRHQVSALTRLTVTGGQPGLCTEPARPEISVWSSAVMAEQDSSLALPCRTGRPGLNTNNINTTTSWTNPRGEQVEGQRGDRLRVIQSGDLEISGLTWADMGQYTCSVSNPAGTDSIQTFLYPLTVPSTTNNNK